MDNKIILLVEDNQQDEPLTIRALKENRLHDEVVAETLRLILVEDLESDAQLVLRSLSTAGFAVESRRVMDEAELRVELAKSKPDVVLSDFNVPGFGAEDALAVVRELSPETPFLVVSGAIGEETAVALMRSGAQDFVMKSNLSRLAPAVQRSLREAQWRVRERQAREEAARAISERERMLAVVTHDIRTPLNALSLAIGLMSRLLSQPQTQKRETQIEENLNRMRRSARRMQDLVSDLLDVTKIEAGTFVVDRKVANAEELLIEIEDAFRPIASEKSILLRVFPPVEEGVVQGCFDSGRVYQALANLVGNAIKFTPIDGSVTVFLERESDSFVFGVEDTGPGIPESHRPHIFDRLWQAQRESRDGTGLGLFIAKGIADAHKGNIWFESQEGKGTTFFLRVPLNQDASKGESLSRELRDLSREADSARPSLN